jgi:hypothetical protein
MSVQAQSHLSKEEKEAQLKAKYPVGMTVITQNITGHHKLVNGVIGVVLRHEHCSFMRQLCVAIGYTNGYMEDYYVDELEDQNFATGIEMASVKSHTLASDVQIARYMESESFHNMIQTARERVLARRPQ